jgi:serine/threonine protein kinase
MADATYRHVPENVITTAVPMAYVRLGKKARVYKVAKEDGTLHALKVFYRGLTEPEYVPITKQLNRFSDEPGLSVCRRRLVDEYEASRLGEPGLTWSIFMPWIDGTPWVDVIETQRPLSRQRCAALARATATVLAGLESRQLAHGDISGANVLISGLKSVPMVELIDVEDMYHPEFGSLLHEPDGSTGYSHPGNKGLGCRNPLGDRFAAGILLAEILTWHDPAIRAQVGETSLFEQDELCVSRHPKFGTVKRLLSRHSPAIADLFQQTWHSAGLAECPRLADWAAALGADLPAEAAKPAAPLTPMPEQLQVRQHPNITFRSLKDLPGDGRPTTGS